MAPRYILSLQLAIFITLMIKIIAQHIVSTQKEASSCRHDFIGKGDSLLLVHSFGRFLKHPYFSLLLIFLLKFNSNINSK